MAVAWKEQTLQLGDVKLRVVRGGAGRPVLVLHHDIGTPDRLPFYDALAEKFDVILPNHPGFGEAEKPQWLRHPRDLAALYQWLLADLGADQASLLGLGFGGWIAAEMAALAPRDFRRLVLVGAMGVRPPEGDI
ncbi:MAG: alpha/beta fold hydrolase, partial [Alphaproteobacteria bacterium]|nr:alpha/beta fold hydrolase [Alphaproteobacteria bacterium]